MYCTNCGSQIPDGAKFCTVCGAPVSRTASMPQNAQAAPVYEEAPVRAAAPVRAQQPAYQAPQAVPVYATPAVKDKKTTRWPVSTGIMGILHLFFYLVAMVPMYLYYDQMGIPGAMISWSRILYVVLAFLVPILFFVHTKKIAILTAIPMIVILILEGINTFSSFRYLGSTSMLTSLLTFVPMFILTALYVIQMLARPHSAALPIIYLIFAILTIVWTFIMNIRYFQNGYSYVYIALAMLIIWLSDIFAYVAYIIAMFSSRKR
ncbi:MAG: zinc-ribbon domain-containing protein [Lachnospiraceae bacterium]|nr:zinc-ribbon domain-containing protein [Lachnospiraceae bacterium]